MASRVVVFIDYQNVYRRAREAFSLEFSSHVQGQVHPLRLGIALKNMVPVGERELTEVRIYRGLPSSRHDPKGYAAADRQIALWKQQALVTAITRPLNYRDPDHPQEKGIDVSIAVDFVRMAYENAYDIGVLFSGDTDLVPALEAVIAMKGEESCEVAGWMPLVGSPKLLRVAGKRMHLHYLGKDWYDRVHDNTDYNLRRRRR